MDRAIGNITLGSIWSEVIAVARRHWRVLLVSVVALGLFDTTLDALRGYVGSNGAGNIVSFVVVFFVLRGILRTEGLIENEGGFVAYFVASLLSGIGIVIGLVLLIVPGLYLLARWSIAPALVLTRGRRGVEAMRESWQLTRDDAWQLVLAYVIFGLMIGIPVAIVAGIGVALDAQDSIALQSIANVLANAFGPLSLCLTVAIYRLLGTRTRELRDVFE